MKSFLENNKQKKLPGLLFFAYEEKYEGRFQSAVENVKHNEVILHSQGW